MNRYETRHSDFASIKTEAPTDFAKITFYEFEGKQDYLDLCLTFVVQIYKNVTAGWQLVSHEKIDDSVTLSTLNVSFR